MRSFGGRVAAVTGAGSGIGRALAVELSRRGAQVALADVDGDGLAAAASQCRELGAEVSSAQLDVADRDALFAWAERVEADHGAVHLVINNAGIALGAMVRDAGLDDIDRLLDVNLRGVVYGTKAFLPALERSGDGHVVNISSVFGLLSVPTQSAYNAAKFGVRGFTDTLRMELEIQGGRVSATTVHPGGVRTHIARNAVVDPSLQPAGDDASAAEFDRLARTSPEQAAEVILRAVLRNRRRVLVGLDAWILDGLARLPSSLTQRLLIREARRRMATAGADRELAGPGTADA